MVVYDAGTRIEWEWALAGYDIKFSALFTAKDGGASVEVVAPATVDSSAGAQRGLAPGPGRTLAWDNTHSMLRSKQVTFTSTRSTARRQQML